MSFSLGIEEGIGGVSELNCKHLNIWEIFKKRRKHINKAGIKTSITNKQTKKNDKKKTKKVNEIKRLRFVKS